MKIFFLICLSLLSRPALATLGEVESTVATDEQSLSGQEAAAPVVSNGYTLHSFSSHGNQIKECVSPQGKIVAVTWRGIKEPNLSILLGSLHAEYKNLKDNHVRKPGRKPLVIQTSKIVVSKGGHARDLTGTAYLLEQFPNGLGAECAQ